MSGQGPTCNEHVGSREIPATPASGAVKLPFVTQKERKSTQYYFLPKKERTAFLAPCVAQKEARSQGGDSHSVYQLTEQGGTLPDLPDDKDSWARWRNHLD